MCHSLCVHACVPTCQGHSVEVQVSPSKLLRMLLDCLSSHCLRLFTLPQGNLTERGIWDAYDYFLMIMFLCSVCYLNYFFLYLHKGNRHQGKAKLITYPQAHSYSCRTDWVSIHGRRSTHRTHSLVCRTGSSPCSFPGCTESGLHHLIRGGSRQHSQTRWKEN